MIFTNFGHVTFFHESKQSARNKTFHFQWPLTLAVKIANIAQISLMCPILWTIIVLVIFLAQLVERIGQEYRRGEGGIFEEKGENKWKGKG